MAREMKRIDPDPTGIADLERAADRHGRGIDLDLAVYERRSRYVSMVMSSFMLRHLRRLYHAFASDLVAPIILGEIAHYNVGHQFAQKGFPTDAGFSLDGRPAGEFRPCNAFSISEATGIPRETVRRRVQVYVRRGWLVRRQGGLVVSPTLAEAFLPMFNLVTVKDFLATGVRLGEVLELHGSVAPAGDSERGVACNRSAAPSDVIKVKSSGIC
jgi:hypothetical protein